MEIKRRNRMNLDQLKPTNLKSNLESLRETLKESFEFDVVEEKKLANRDKIRKGEIYLVERKEINP
jgi:hypothetical protein